MIDRKPDISLVIPCFNEEESIPLFYAETCGVLELLKDDFGFSGSEFVFIDDGSIDGTLRVLRELAEKDSRVHYVSFSRNFGKEAALFAGLGKSRGRYVVTLDVDLQDPPALIPEMLRSILVEGYDCAGSRRVTRKGEPVIRSLFARLFYRIMACLCDIEVVDGARDFRVMGRPYVDAVLQLRERNRFSKGIFPWVGFKTKWFEYENIERAAGETKWSFWKLFFYSLDGITAFSTRPLAIASIIGALMSFLSVVAIIFIVIRYQLFGDPVQGWASLACIILFCSGLQLCSAGIIGQYLAKTYLEVKQRPVYIAREEK